MTRNSTATAERGQGTYVSYSGPIDRWAVLQLVKDSAPVTGIREREISILAAHLSVLPKGMLDPSQLLVSYAQVTGMLERANCMDERRFRRGEARLEELGFVHRKLSGNGRRFPVRDGNGSIVDAYGIDLRPLFARISELQQALQNHREGTAKLRAIRSRISARLTAVKRAAHCDTKMLTVDLAEKLARYRNRLRRRDTSLNDMIQLEHEVASLELGDPTEATTPPANTTADQHVEPKELSADDRQIDRHIESLKKENISSGNSMAQTDPQLVWTQCRNLLQFYPTSPSSAQAIARTLYEFFGFLGLRQTMKENIFRTFGLSNAVRIADYIAGRINSISQPTGYVFHMIKEYRKGNPVAGGTVSALLTGHL